MAHWHDPRKVNLPAVYVVQGRKTQRIRTLDTSQGTTKTTLRKGTGGGNEEEMTDMSLNNIKSPIFDLLTYQNTQKRDSGCKHQRNPKTVDSKKG